MQNQLNIVGIQADLIWEKPNENISYFEEQIQNLNTAVDLLILPELFNTGFSMNVRQIAEKMDGKTVLWMQKMAKKYSFAICGSLAIKENELFYNRFVFVHPSGKINLYDKRHTFTLAGEHKVYTAGNEKKIIIYKGWKICPLICYDLRFPVWSRNTENYDVLLYVANWPTKRITAWQTLLKARAIENMCYTIGVNRTGKDQNEYEYSGNSLIFDYLGEELASLPKNKTGNVIALLGKEHQGLAKEKLGFLNDRDCFIIEK